MAAKRLVLCPRLCFILSKFLKLDDNKIKKALVGFHSHVDIIDAKEHLIKVSEDIEDDDVPKLPAPPRLRASDIRITREIKQRISSWQRRETM